MNIDVTEKNINFFEVLSSKTRIKIINLLKEKPRNVQMLAKELNLSSAIITRHIQKMESSNIVKSKSIPGKRGMQKICNLNIEKAILLFNQKENSENYLRYSISPGQYTKANVLPTCGLASKDNIIGIIDDPRYFSDPSHVEASMVWFQEGFVEYIIPNYLNYNQTIENLDISFEICSEAPDYKENWPSDICFYINDILLGMWTSPGDFGKENGILTPKWWNMGTKHGLLKRILINKKGSFIDGVKLSDKKISDLNITQGNEIAFRIKTDSSSKNSGGVSLFGKYFGNYMQDINIAIKTKNIKRP